ncbi:MAG: zinc-binding dehydrogenase [Clostridiaceae bacterium]|nr:zinc-binding dehydrogenase [Clostridiaceae bacterium]
MDAIFNFLKQHWLEPRLGAAFAFSDIRKACMALDTGRADGKIVVEI